MTDTGKKTLECARVVRMPDGSSHLVIWDYQSDWYRHYEQAYNDAFKLNAAFSARVGPLVEALEACVAAMRSGDNRNIMAVYDTARKALEEFRGG